MKVTDEKKRPTLATKKPARRTQYKSEELKTEAPISEKDEVKHAERKMRKNTSR